MPRLAILSDTHFERRPPPEIDLAALPEFDILIHAGDLAERDLDQALDWLARLADGRPAVWCPGNHDLYGSRTRWENAPLIDRVSEVAFAASGRGIATLGPVGSTISTLLCGLASPTPSGCFDLPGLVVVGSTLWTDWRLAGLWTMIEPYAQVDLEASSLDMMRGVRPMSSPDFLSLRDRFGREWTPLNCSAEHAIHLDAIDQALSGLAPRGEGSRDQATVVVTHHAPHPTSVEPYRDAHLPMWAPGFYASDLSWLIERHRPDLWVHGHVHVPVDYVVDRTRIVSNPCPGSFSLKIVEV
jgi:predicted phosphodiesterase